MSGKVYTSDQQYIRKQQGKAAILEKLGHEDFGLQPYAIASKTGTTSLPETKRKAAEHFDSLEELLVGEKVIRDYAKRPLAVDSDNFINHTSNQSKSMEQWTAYLQAIAETISRPNETWITGKKLDQIIYFRYYGEKTIITIKNIKNGKLELQTWFDLADDNKALVEKYRKGLLIQS